MNLKSTIFLWDGSHLVQETHKAKNVQNAQRTDRTFTDSYEPLAQCIG
ncbi:hypothetical protein [Rodentibacter caecimuris]|nr:MULTISPECIES: hypothetical protein [Pasteurellaceae]MCX2962419.1 hypothetical protein [Rodentibacter heylii]